MPYIHIHIITTVRGMFARLRGVCICTQSIWQPNLLSLNHPPGSHHRVFVFVFALLFVFVFAHRAFGNPTCFHLIILILILMVYLYLYMLVILLVFVFAQSIWQPNLLSLNHPPGSHHDVFVFVFVFALLLYLYLHTEHLATQPAFT